MFDFKFYWKYDQYALNEHCFKNGKHAHKLLIVWGEVDARRTCRRTCGFTLTQWRHTNIQLNVQFPSRGPTALYDSYTSPIFDNQSLTRHITVEQKPPASVIYCVWQRCMNQTFLWMSNVNELIMLVEATLCFWKSRTLIELQGMRYFISCWVFAFLKSILHFHKCHKHAHNV